MLLLLAACQPNGEVALPPTAIPFPTVTPGRLVRGVLPTVVGLALDGSVLANPATAVALANRPTATPDYDICPTRGAPELGDLPPNGSAAAITRFLSAGGTVEALDAALRDDWGVLGDSGVVRGDLDFNGGGEAEVVIAYNSPSDGGTMLILGCVSGVYAPLYESVGGSIPQIVGAGDMNYDGRPELLFSSRVCSGENSDDCAYRSQLLSWSAEAGQFVSLLGSIVNSAQSPMTNDVDNDQVAEIVVRLTDDGSATTGPLRTGVHIYDWNGTNYVLSIIQLDPPQFKIQVVHEADRAFNRLDTDQAISLYTQSRSNNSLRFWLNDEPTVLDSYTFYRLVLLYAYTEDDDLLATYQAALAAYPDPAAAPVYIEMLNAFWNGLQVTNNLNSACREVQAVITARPEAVGLLNRYGNRSPVYTAEELCPF